jgi:hypothetical protein
LGLHLEPPCHSPRLDYDGWHIFGDWQITGLHGYTPRLDCGGILVQIEDLDVEDECR